jgi:hypothetical protein
MGRMVASNNILFLGESMEKKASPKLADLDSGREIAEVVLQPTGEQVSRLCTLLHNGCYVKVPCGISLHELLCSKFGIDPEYVRKDIKVIFLENGPVDNLDTAIVKDGLTLALSAAMPGLVGAAMSRDGLSWMRSSITYHEEDVAQSQGVGLIKLKLFNQVMADLGAAFLKRGIYVNSRYLAAFLARFTDDFWSDFGAITRDGVSVACLELIQQLNDQDQWVRFTVC